MVRTKPVVCQCVCLGKQPFHEQFILLFHRERFRMVNFTFYELPLLDNVKKAIVPG